MNPTQEDGAVNKKTTPLTGALRSLQETHIDFDSDSNKAFWEEMCAEFGQIQFHILWRISDWQAVGVLKKYMLEKNIQRIIFGSAYTIDDRGEKQLHLTVKVSYVGEDLEGFDEYAYDIQKEIGRIFYHRPGDFLEGMTVDINNFDAFVKDLVGDEEFAKHEKYILDSASKAGTFSSETQRV